MRINDGSSPRPEDDAIEQSFLQPDDLLSLGAIAKSVGAAKGMVPWLALAVKDIEKRQAAKQALEDFARISTKRSAGAIEDPAEALINRYKPSPVRPQANVPAPAPGVQPPPPSMEMLEGGRGAQPNSPVSPWDLLAAGATTALLGAPFMNKYNELEKIRAAPSPSPSPSPSPDDIEEVRITNPWKRMRGVR